MKRRRKLAAGDRIFPCIEVRFRDRRILHARKAVCLACYVTLPKCYKGLAAGYGSPVNFAARGFDKIVYSFLIIPVENDEQGSEVALYLHHWKDIALKVFR
jgi:hypothetical protein